MKQSKAIKILVVNTTQTALSEIQKQMKGEAEKVGFQAEDDVISYIKELRALNKTGRQSVA
ncbi:MAG: hypothetical protein IKP62_05910 [Salinivirgaceae bacterium]|nr:hypothetical protein [Salinivirgaceae bacterium]